MHFTYSSRAHEEDLQQGDVLKRTQEFEKVLEQVHPHYQRSEYPFFIVLTQSCDLVRRSSDAVPATRYIVIAAVRKMSLSIQRYAESLRYSPVERAINFASEDRKEKVKAFVERLLNNNEKDYFFLRAEPEVGLPEDHCAFLHLSIALKADLHYEKVRAARILGLTDAFQHKLGWLVGNTYARVGTEDWVPNNASPEDFETLVKQRVGHTGTLLWIEKSLHRQVVRELERCPASDWTENKLTEIVKELTSRSESKRKMLLDLIGQELTRQHIGDEVRDKIKRNLENNSSFRSTVK